MNWKHFADAVLAGVSIGVVAALGGAFAGLSSRLIAPITGALVASMIPLIYRLQSPRN
jgi:hypothetical protein